VCVCVCVRARAFKCERERESERARERESERESERQDSETREIETRKSAEIPCDQGGRIHGPPAKQQDARASMRHGFARLPEEPFGPRRKPHPRDTPGGAAVEVAEVDEARAGWGLSGGGAKLGQLQLEGPEEGEEVVRLFRL